MNATPHTQSEDLGSSEKGVLPVVFVTLLLDLIGFSIIFPLFPSMLSYYLGREGDSGLLGAVVSGIEQFTFAAGGPQGIGVIVLFGGVLSALYSLLQFICAPILGSLSDRYGRRPILLVSIAGIALSYALWFVAGRFYLLVLARILGGIMAGNISTATAIVADVTTKTNRSRGMAVIGIAFGVGFVIGPAIGGFSAEWDLTRQWPALADYGVNPFSAPALAAFVLSVANFMYVALRFKETRPANLSPDGDAGVSKSRAERTINPISLFRTQEYPGVTKTNLVNFLFITTFSGMEFSLTFLAVDRLSYGTRQNAYMFLFIGVVLALVQGTYVRRRSPVIGAKRMAVHGFIAIIPGLVLTGMAYDTITLYAGLFFMSAGSALVIPCLAALASVYTPTGDQGRVLGIFRSVGALARAVGPLLACIAYWRLGSGPAYFLGAAAIALPLILTSTLPGAALPVPGQAES